MCDRFKFRIWNEEDNRYLNNNEFTLSPDGELLLNYSMELLVSDYDPFDVCDIEQCTGLEDKNGKLIYESDILEDEDGCICYVIWNDCGWWVKSPGSEALDNEYPDFYSSCSVVGNIHQNEDILYTFTC